MGELKPCRFCGHEKAASIETNDEYLDESLPVEQLRYRVICDFNDGGCGSSTGFHKTAPEAVDFWNTRAPSPALARLREEIEGAPHGDGCKPGHGPHLWCYCWKSEAEKLLKEI